MEKVRGIGGLFFRAKDPASLARWYLERLGVDLTPTNYDEGPWHKESGPTIFTPCGAQTVFAEDPERVWMVNFRVRDLEAMVAQLRAAGVEVTLDATAYPNGRFAQLRDPEGNPIELWQPSDRPPLGALAPNGSDSMSRPPSLNPSAPSDIPEGPG